ncbi:MAG TPA: PA14 domain-containing protein [Bryobacteraceae bacterium]|nr:PA14 domain-containing protein [Bryobacteraceae bacterium]
MPLSLFLLAVLAQAPADAAPPVPTFGTTVVIPFGLRGEIYHIHKGSKHLPRFARMKPVGAIYTTTLDVPTRNFKEGFPGVTDRLEWFAIDYTGRFWIQTPGIYEFELTSDDGARLYIDDREVIDNDGEHQPVTLRARVRLTGGIHRIHVPYFQGPQYQVALVLKVAGPDDVDLRIFSTDEFKPPPHPEDWKYSNAGDLDNPQ